MDEGVSQSLIKWPNVPHCFGWLALDRRGAWRMRDDYTQAHGLPGDAIKHAALNAFIARNYASDADGRYFFQNGPQRVYVNLEVTPWVVRMMPTGNTDKPWEFQTQCESLLLPTAAFMDEAGDILIEGELTQTRCTGPSANQFSEIKRLSIALLHDHDLELFSGMAALDHAACALDGKWLWHGKHLPLEPITREEVVRRFRFQARPHDDAKPAEIP
jgi:hypothetical protein